MIVSDFKPNPFVNSHSSLATLATKNSPYIVNILAGGGCVPISLYLQKQVTGHILCSGFSLPISGLGDHSCH